MGGDDLGSDDEQWMDGVPGSPTGRDDDREEQDTTVAAGSAAHGQLSSSKKRKAEEASTSESGSKKKSKHKSPQKILLEAGRKVENLSANEQALFLSAAVRDFSMLSSNEEVPNDMFLPANFHSPSNADSLLQRLKDAIASKRLKKWKHLKSPCVVVVCISARRAVAILKELAPLGVRAAKLFPKNGTVTEQEQQLASAPFGIAVGTPHRLHALLFTSKVDNADASMNLRQTQLVVLDSHVSNKQFTVCTLPDTAPDCMRLLKDFVVPQLKGRKDLKIAFL